MINLVLIEALISQLALLESLCVIILTNLRKKSKKIEANTDAGNFLQDSGRPISSVPIFKKVKYLEMKL